MSFLTSRGDIAELYQSGVEPAISRLVTSEGNRASAGPESPSTYQYIDEKQRLELWAQEHGVKEGQLDYRLREASLLKERVLLLLTNLIRLTGFTDDTEFGLDESCEEASAANGNLEPKTSVHIQSNKNVTRDRPKKRSIEDKSSSGIDTNISLEDSVPDSPAAQVHDTISLLFELGPSLLDPAPHDRLRTVATNDADRFDIEHVRSKFPKADQKLVSRIGVANWERRQSLRNLRRKHETAFGLIRTVQTFESSSEEGSTNDKEVDVSSQADSANSDGLLEPSAAARLYPDTPNTQLSVSESVFSGHRTRSTPATAPSTLYGHRPHEDKPVEQFYTVQHPPAPNDKYTGQAFLCPYCFKRLSGISSFSQWRRHVFEDLEPYMCTYQDCVQPGKTYSDQRRWWEHEIEEHRVIKSWRCTPCATRDHESEFETVETFNQHIIDHHPTISTPAQRWSIRKLCQERKGMASHHSKCPFCQDEFHFENNTSSRIRERLVKRHVSKHLEQLALFVAYPAGQMVFKDDDSKFVDDSDSEAEYKTEIESIFSDDKRMSRKDVYIANMTRYIAVQDTDTANGDSATMLTREVIEARQPDAAQPVFPIRLWLHPPNEQFYGRRDSIAQVRSILRLPGSICLLHGVGGVGKTLTANEYIYGDQDHYDAIFWLQADTAPSLSDSYMQMVIGLGLNSSLDDHLQAIEKGRTWLQETSKRWILIFDNSLTWEQISPYLPNSMQQTHGSVLITAQHEGLVQESQNITKLRLEPLSEIAGAEMLLSYLNKDTHHDPEKVLAQEISAFVGGLPVAIAQVAGYADVSGCSLEELLETFREWRKRTGAAVTEDDDMPMSFRQAAFSYEDTWAMVSNVTLRELSRDAQDIMNILAYLNCEAVPQSMLFKIHEDPLLHFLDGREKIRLRNIRDSLIKRKLVQYKEVENEWCFSIHRSLQRCIRETLALDTKQQQVVFNQAIALLREIFPRSNPIQQPTPEKWNEYQRLLPHLHALHEVYNQGKPDIKGSVDFAQLLSDAGMDQFERGITREALLLLKTAEEVLDTVSSQDHESLRADIHVMISIMYDNMGIKNRKEGLERRKIALGIRRKIVESSSPPRRNDEILLYNLWMEYAISLLHYHRFEEAEPVIESCIRKYREWGSESEIPFEYAKYYNKIAIVRMYQERFEEAIELATRGAYLMSKTGYVLFETRYRFDLACIILQSGDVDKALQVHREIFAMRLEKLGQLNELTLHSRYAIGAIYEIKKQFEEAEVWFRKALDQRRGVSSWPEEAFSRAQFHLAKVIQHQGQPEDLKVVTDLRDKALQVLHQLLPLDHPDELKNCSDKSVLFDHMLTVAGARFTGRGLLGYFSKPVPRT